MSSAARLYQYAFALSALPLIALACGGEGSTDIVLPPLTITTATSGVELDPDGYNVSVDAQTPQPIAANATLTTERLAEGAHTVELSGIAANCTVGGENPRSVVLQAGVTETVPFIITCSPTTGSVQVVTTTSGASIDPDGYSLLLDGADQGVIGVAGTRELAVLTPGSHTIGLSGVAANCQVSGEAFRQIEVPEGGSAQVSFAVTCSAPGPTTATLEVVTATTGSGTDPDGFSILLDGADQGTIPVTATKTLTGLAPDSYTVGLSGVAANCEVAGTNPRPATLVAGQTLQVIFTVTCIAVGPATGTLRVAAVTSGSAQDPDGYQFSLDGGSPRPIGTNQIVTLANLSVAQHTVELIGLAPNCSLSGDNPLGVAISPGEIARVTFTVSCAATPGPTTATLEVVTTTTGTDTDPDGFSILLDGANQGAIPVTGTKILTGLAPNSHTVGLSDVAANCEVSGNNPRPATLVAGQTLEVAFAVTCTAVGPTTGTLRVAAVTSGSAQDPDGYQFSLDGGSPRPIGSNQIVTVANLSAAQHTVELKGLASNCSLSGDNPLGVAITPGEVARVTFTVSCAATQGSLTVTVSGLPTGVAAAVTVDGPGSFSQLVTATGTLTSLNPGSYQISAADVVAGTTTYHPSVSRPAVSVVAGSVAEVSVTYTAVNITPTLDLTINGLYITQSSQTLAGEVPLVAGRDGFLRVFVLANERNTVRPAVRVTLSTGGTFNIPGGNGSTPTQVEEGTLGSSWNILIPGNLIQTGLSVVAEVDPTTLIPESNDGNNRFPATGSKNLTVRSVPVAKIRFISVQQPGSSVGGDVSNRDRLIDLARRMHPLDGIDVAVDPQLFPASAPLETNGSGWLQLLSDLDGKRVTEGTGQIYYGVVKLGYGRSEGLVGLTLGQGVQTAAGWDDADDAGRVVAHELGHVWGRKHSPCGNPPDVDGSYRYPGGIIGVYGMDVDRGALKAPSSPDIMSYCFANPWISDYTYTNVMNFRASQAAVAQASAPVQPSILIWGRLVNGRPVLEPAFQIVSRPSLPQRRGPYSITGTALDGSRIFDLSFDLAVAQDGPAGNGHFAFTVPLTQAQALRLGSIRLDGPSGSVSSPRPSAQLRTTASAESIVARREGANVSLRWDAAQYPMIMIRDPDSGEVLSFGRDGRAVVRTGKAVLDLDISDGVRSQRVRLAISRS